MRGLFQLWLIVTVTFLLFSCSQESKPDKVKSQAPEPVIEAPEIIEGPEKLMKPVPVKGVMRKVRWKVNVARES
ncbi:hypothetical protein [Candidatus Colwellia aromaticivorans]|uniref:hypothetical protein n=1 Tax=Candidatus Colwellia aromaticivorans TaxID=2267621 RepID=UPI000DF453BD|nr:hypothetical protein [Candidatus Colwellia aromaticivorans]